MMKKRCFAFLFFVSVLCYSQPYSSLLKNADFTIVKIQWNDVEYLPPTPFAKSGKVLFDYNNDNGFKASFYNTVLGNVTFGADNATYFSLQNVGVTLVQYGGENFAAVQQFDQMASDFYLDFPPTAQFSFDYQEVFSGKNLIITNPLGQKIFYSTTILANREVASSTKITLYPNPAKDGFFLKFNKNISEKVVVEIFDVTGKLVSTQQINSSQAVETRSLTAGIYQVKVVGNDFTEVTKLVIRK